MRTLTGLCFTLLLVALSLGLCLFPPRRAAAAPSNFTVNSLADTPDASASDGLCADAGGACTLRAAIQQANADPAADTIGFSVVGTINLTGALPNISTDMTIDGPRTGGLTVRRDTGGDYRIFTVNSGVTAAFNGFVIANGAAPNGAPGGGILNSGMLSMTSVGDQPANPRYLAFLADAQEAGGGVIVGEFDWQNRLESSRLSYLNRFVQRPDFLAAHGGQNAGQYVDSLFANAGVTPTQAERDAAISAYNFSGRASALRSVAESASVYNKLYNPGFVLMQYFAYLRRNPDAAPDNNFDGYNYWLSKLDQFTQPGEDARDESVALARVRRAEMVRAFLLSSEYRGRFQGDPSRGQ